MEQEEDLMTTGQAAKAVGVSPEAIYAAIKREGPNRLPARQVVMPEPLYPMWLISRADLMAWNERRPTERTKRRAQVVRDYKEGRRPVGTGQGAAGVQGPD